MEKLVIGMFGTCGSSKWRDPFIREFEARGMKYYNPLKDDWKPEDSKIEAEHLASDDIILLPITDETYGTASLAEIGFAIVEVMKNPKKYVVIYIAPKLHESLSSLITSYKESNNARSIILSHLAKFSDPMKTPAPNVYVVGSLEDMLSVTTKLYGAVTRLREAGIYDPA